MKNILVINGHPNFNGAFANRAILDELVRLLPSVKVHALAGARGEKGFNVPEEQKLLRSGHRCVRLSRLMVLRSGASQGMVR